MNITVYKILLMINKNYLKLTLKVWKNESIFDSEVMKMILKEIFIEFYIQNSYLSGIKSTRKI